MATKADDVLEPDPTRQLRMPFAGQPGPDATPDPGDARATEPIDGDGRDALEGDGADGLGATPERSDAADAPRDTPGTVTMSTPLEIPPIPDKHVFKIGEVGRIVGVKTHVLRFWETEFAAVRPRKGRNGHRQYSRDDVERLCEIKCLLHDRGMTIAGARALMKDGTEAVRAVLAGTPVEAASALEEAQDRCAALETQLGQARERLKTLERTLRRAEEEARFWRTATQTAEGRLDALKAVVQDEADQLSALLAAESEKGSNEG